MLALPNPFPGCSGPPEKSSLTLHVVTTGCSRIHFLNTLRRGQFKPCAMESAFLSLCQKPAVLKGLISILGRAHTFTAMGHYLPPSCRRFRRLFTLPRRCRFCRSHHRCREVGAGPVHQKFCAQSAVVSNIVQKNRGRNNVDRFLMQLLC